MVCDWPSKAVDSGRLLSPTPCRAGKLGTVLYQHAVLPSRVLGNGNAMWEHYNSPALNTTILVVPPATAEAIGPSGASVPSPPLICKARGNDGYR